jgi:hypothetical protein
MTAFWPSCAGSCGRAPKVANLVFVFLSGFWAVLDKTLYVIELYFNVVVSSVGACRHVYPRTSTKLASHKVVRATNPKIVPAPNKWRSQ